MTEGSYAMCRGCGRPTRQSVVRLEKPDEGTGYVVIPVYHQECVPEEKRAGQRWLRSGK